MITRNEIKNFRVEFAETVKSLEKKYGVKIDLGSISYDDTSFHGKMTCTKLSETGVKLDKTVTDFDFLKVLLGLKANIGDVFVAQGKKLTISGLDGKKPKYPVICKGEDGKSYKVGVSMVNILMEKGARK